MSVQPTDNLILRWRKFFGENQEDFAERVGYTRNTIYRWEKERPAIDEIAMGRVAKAIGISLPEFLEGPGQKVIQTTMLDESNVNSISPTRDPRSPVFSSISSPLAYSFQVGFSSMFETMPNPEDISIILTDDSGQPLNCRSYVAVAPIDGKPSAGEEVLIWEPNGDDPDGVSRIVKWSEEVESGMDSDGMVVGKIIRKVTG